MAEKEFMKVGEYAGYKAEYPDGIGYCFGMMFPSAVDERQPGLIMCMDIEGENIDKIIELIGKMKEMEPIDCTEDE